MPRTHIEVGRTDRGRVISPCPDINAHLIRWVSDERQEQ
jgi:hypothetical protein